MKIRCENIQDPAYGGRGIRVCERWRNSYEHFLADMGPKPSERHSVDRIDTDGDYTTENCRWASPKVQARNRRNTKRILLNGQIVSLAEAAETHGINYGTVHRRLLNGQTPEQALGLDPDWKKKQQRKAVNA